MALQLMSPNVVALHSTVVECTCSGTVYNRGTPYESWYGVGGKQTPAMAAGITAPGWTIQELLSLHVPPN
jgi:hypothetical protein